ncbi:uncharacterized protein TNCT_725041 [Trichonephila clavata]|uniref:Uncharacterized protein n=1 Tax=Trichonephila clavata TaxID=2740835 RepID=A0A8X6KRS8_TRICU|nr:uncharacterized protein TNCT_725041 [Trichonephila clavata]
MSNYMSIQNSKTRVIKNELQTTGRVRANDQSVEDVKITNDHAFYKLICEKQAHGDVSVEQFNSLYYEISEKMIKKPFTIQEINDFCKDKGIPLFTTDELLTLVPKDETKYYVDYETNSVRGHDHGYMADQINIKASYIEKDLINHPDYQNYIMDSDSYYKFIYKKLILETLRDRALDMFNGGKTEEQVREYLNRINTNNKTIKEVKELLEAVSEGSLKGWLNDPLNKGYTDVEYHVLYEKISEELVHTSMSIDQIKGIYNQYGITPPTDSELGGMKKVQEETRSSEHYEQKTGLTFQGRINLEVTDDNHDNKFNLNIDLFQDKNFEDLIDQNGDGVINNQNLLKSLEDTVKTFNEVFGIKKDNNPLLVHGNVANFRLFLFEDHASYQKYLSGQYGGQIPGGGAADSSDNNYISDMYSHAENARGDRNHDGKTDHKDYNYVIKHELVHALTFYLTSKLDLGKVLMEGLAEYVTHLTEGEKPADFAKLVSEEYKEHTLEEIVKGAIDPYQTGAAAIAYIEETYPNFIDNLLHAATEDRKTINGRFYFKEMMQRIYQSEAEKIQKGEGFSNWVKTHSSTEDSSVDAQSEHQSVDNKEDEVQPDNSREQISEKKAEVQPTGSLRGLEALKKPVIHEHNEEKIILKDTILKMEKSREQDSEGKHKANVAIGRNDIEALYNKAAEGAEKQSVLKFWHKLHTSEYKVGALPEDKYYFKDGKFVIHDSGAKKLIVLPEDKVSIKIMKDGDHYDLAISDEKGKVISSITKVDDLNYELLSDTSGFSLETQDSTIFLGQHNEYNSYLENGFVKMFDCPSNYAYHDHNSDYIYS